MRRLIITLLLVGTLFTLQAQRLPRPSRVTTFNQWVGTWAAAPQPVVKSYMPFNNKMDNRSVRQIIKVSAGGDIVRLRLSNEYSTEPIEIHSVYISNVTDSFAIEPESSEYLRFHNHKRVVIAPGKSVVSDAERFRLRPLQRLAITINYKTAPTSPTVHMGSRTTSYILKGYSSPQTSFERAFREDHWFNIQALEVLNMNATAVAILGNSITDGKNSTTNHQNRWPDIMSDVLNAAALRDANARQTGVLNLGIGNNRVLTVGLGSPGKDRFHRDILQQKGLRDVIIFEGINDIGVSKDIQTTIRKLIEEYTIMARKAHEQHLKVYGATIMPMLGCGYYTDEHERGREELNRWIRETNVFDGVIDFDLLMRDPADRRRMRAEWQSDWLHPNAQGYAEMGRFAAEFLQKQGR